MGPLYRLVYTSVRKPECDDEELQKILLASRRNNASLHITGVLMHSQHRFIQYLEGEKDALLELFERIKDDPRHTHVNQRNFEPIDHRAFPSWQMAYKDLSASILRFNSPASGKDIRDFEQLIKGEVDFTNEGMSVLHLFFNMA